MPTFKSQVLYNLTGDTKPAVISKDDAEIRAVHYADFLESIGEVESAIGQSILQDNADSTRLNKLISEQGLTSLGGGAVLSDVIAEVNKMNTILTNLVLNGK